MDSSNASLILYSLLALNLMLREKLRQLSAIFHVLILYVTPITVAMASNKSASMQPTPPVMGGLLLFKL